MAPRAGQGSRGRWIAVGAVAMALLAVPAAAAASPAKTRQAHAASKTATSILHTKVPAKGKYLVIVWVRSRGKHARLVEVYLQGQQPRSVVANPWWGAAVYYSLNLSPSVLVVRTVNAPPAVAIRTTLTLRKAAAGSSPKAPTSTNSAPPSTTTSTSPTTTTTTTTTTPPGGSTPPVSSGPYTVNVFTDDFATDYTAGGNAPNQLPNPKYWNLDNWGGCGNNPTPNTVGDTLSTNNTDDAADTGYDVDGFNPAQSAYLTSNGLAITAVRNPAVPANSLAGNTYISAQVDSSGPAGFSAQYGEVEASIDMPSAQGLCPGFWMLGDNNIAGSNIPGEIDVVEAPTFGDGPGSSSDYFDLHGTSINGTTQQYQSEIPQVAPGFHTYAIIWTPTTMTWEIDGVAYASANQAALVAGASWANDYSYGKFHLIFDLAVGGWSCDFGECEPSTAPAPSYTMYVQWVKWLQLPSS
jgi:hypothetical protein